MKHSIITPITVQREADLPLFWTFSSEASTGGTTLFSGDWSSSGESSTAADVSTTGAGTEESTSGPAARGITPGMGSTMAGLALDVVDAFSP